MSPWASFGMTHFKDESVLHIAIFEFPGKGTRLQMLNSCEPLERNQKGGSLQPHIFLRRALDMKPAWETGKLLPEDERWALLPQTGQGDSLLTWPIFNFLPLSSWFLLECSSIISTLPIYLKMAQLQKAPMAVTITGQHQWEQQNRTGHPGLTQNPTCIFKAINHHRRQSWSRWDLLFLNFWS